MTRQWRIHAGAAPAIVFEHVWFAYDAPVVLEDVTFSISRGDFVSIVGPNGGGKTTLLRLALGLIAPLRGTIAVLGAAPAEARRFVGYVPQHQAFDPQFPVTVLEVTLMGRLAPARPLGPYGRREKELAREALDKVGLLDARDRPFATLSGGQRQRVLIARALASAPELLLMDEPTANVDSPALGELYDLLNVLNRTMTVVLVSHDLGFVSRLVRRVVCVNRTVTTHPVSELSGAELERLYGTSVQMVRHEVRGVEGGCGCGSF